MEIVNYLGEANVVKFMLLFARMSGLVAFFPFFGHMQIPMVVRTAMVFTFTVFLFPFTPDVLIDLTLLSLALAFVSELLLGFMAGTSLYLVFTMLQLAGEQISFVMGFTMANVVDPQSGKSAPLLSQFFTLIALTMLLAFDGHHMMILLYHKSLQALPLGTFYPHISMWEYISRGVLNIFIFGFILSFPIKALSLLADLIFGMLMKTMPQFNLLVVGFPIKIMASFVVMIATLGAIFAVFKKEAISTLEQMMFIFFQAY